MASANKTVGILGGMGPAATVEFMHRIVQKTPARDDSDHIHMLVDNNPQVPSRIKAIIEGTGADPLPELQRMAKGLEAGGADFLVMPCNTAHHYHAAIATAVSIPFLSIVDCTVNYLKAHHPRAARIGLLASPAVRQTGVFDRAFSDNDLTIVYPDASGNDTLLAVIRQVKEGLTGPDQAQAFHLVTEEMAQSAYLALIACTELSVLARKPIGGFEVIDTLDLLVDAVIAEARAS